MSAAEADPAVGAGAPSLFALASPMIVSRAGLAAMSIVDCVMVARFDARQLAFATLAEGTYGRVVDMLASFLLSGLVLVAAAHAGGDAARRIGLWRRSIAAATAMGAVGLALALFGRPILAALGQSPDLIQGGSAVILTIGLGLPAGLVAVASAVALEGARRPSLVAVCVVAANLLNLGLDWLLIGGHFALGAVGSALATSLVRCALALALVGGVLRVEGAAALRRPKAAGPARDQWRLGFAASATSGGMHALAIWLTVFAGWLGVGAVAAYASCWVLNMPGMLLAMGLGDAVAMRVASSNQARPPAPGLFGDLKAIAGLLAPCVLLFCLAPAWVSGLYTHDAALGGLIASLLPLSGTALLLDGLSYGLAAALRGRRDIAGPTAIQLGCMAATPVLAAALAFGLKLGVMGLVVAIVATSTVRLSLLSWRWLGRIGDVTAPTLKVQAA
jgi:MATE family multidrug resistance protein